MALKTDELIHKLCKLLDIQKYILLEGGNAVGKTYLAQKILDKFSNSDYDSLSLLHPGDEYEICSEMISIHPAYAYEDFVYGLSLSVEDNQLSFTYKDKIFVELIEKAQNSWNRREKIKYVLILDDIGRGDISGILGNVLSLIEPHGREVFSVIVGDKKIVLPPNFYIIATKNTLTETVEYATYEMFRHFSTVNIKCDYGYMEDGIFPAYVTDYDSSSWAYYKRVNDVVDYYLTYRYRLSDCSKFNIGHGLFKNDYLPGRIKYNVIPLLLQYLRDGILDKTAEATINNIKLLAEGRYTKDYNVCKTHLTDYRSGVTSRLFLLEGETHKPIMNLISRICEQGMLEDAEIYVGLVHNPNVLVRSSAKWDGKTITFAPPGYLFVEKSRSGEFKYGTAKSTRTLYSATEGMKYDGVEIVVCKEMQPQMYTVWDSQFVSSTYVNERVSTSPNSILFLIVRNYYERIIQNLTGYLEEYAGDNNISCLLSFAQNELDGFIANVSSIRPTNVYPPGASQTEKKRISYDAAEAANRELREVISNLVLIWSDRNSIITYHGNDIIVEGVYKMEMRERYKEFKMTMDATGIHQMILQGPPGTSKTYSAKEFLRYVGKGKSNDKFILEKEIDSYQIIDYDNCETMSEWCTKTENIGKKPPIAWDIVQFHPSYGYEDFVRGIDVSTVKDEETDKSFISYDTVNKILGKMAKLAQKPENDDIDFYLVIDEINRANLATVFGELIYALEYREKDISTPYTIKDGENYSSKIQLPNNLYIVGTMNTADKSIGGIDYAIRRRFLFFSLLPDSKIIEDYKIKIDKAKDVNKQKEINSHAISLFKYISNLFDGANLNSEFYKEDVQIGHTYFLIDTDNLPADLDPSELLYLRFRYQMLPILREYYKDGLFQFEVGEINDGWNGLLKCICGKVNYDTDGQITRKIFNKLAAITNAKE